MKRRLFNLAAAVSLVLCVAMSALWARSYSRYSRIALIRQTWPAHMIWRTSYVGASVVQGSCVVRRSRLDIDIALQSPGAAMGVEDPMRWRREHPGGLRPEFGVEDVRPRVNYLDGVRPHYGFGYRYQTMNVRTMMEVTDTVVFPAWISVLSATVLPLILVSRWHRRRRRIAGSRCPTCGYDLRATPDRCPECGAEAKPQQAEGAAA